MASINNIDILKSIEYAKKINYLINLMIYMRPYLRGNVQVVEVVVWNL